LAESGCHRSLPVPVTVPQFGGETYILVKKIRRRLKRRFASSARRGAWPATAPPGPAPASRNPPAPERRPGRWAGLTQSISERDRRSVFRQFPGETFALAIQPKVPSGGWGRRRTLGAESRPTGENHSELPSRQFWGTAPVPAKLPRARAYTRRRHKHTTYPIALPSHVPVTTIRSNPGRKNAWEPRVAIFIGGLWENS